MSPIHHFFNEELPGRQLPAVMRRQSRCPERLDLAVSAQSWKPVQHLIQIVGKRLAGLQGRKSRSARQCRIAFRTRLQKKNGRQQVEALEYAEDSRVVRRTLAPPGSEL